MVVNESDFTFTSQTGSKPMQYGYAFDCNGGQLGDHCPHFGTATIDTRGTGLIVDPTVEFGAFPYPESFEGSTEDFNRSALGDQISFTCAGWCGSCGPISGPIRFQHSTEFISAADAQAIICHK
uniref:GON domain-containing protein n=2 Tax=Magallana gigas TaxID=29159 RepID=A0A8W8M2S0_MAGGI